VNDDLDLCPGTAPGTIVDADGCPPLPTIAVRLPVTEQILMLGTESVMINYDAQVLSAIAVPGTVTLFVDDDTNPNNGFTVIASHVDAVGLDLESFTTPFPTDLSSGTYFVGASIDDLLSAPISTYANGSVRVFNDNFLSGLEPSESRTLFEAEDIDITWLTDLVDGPIAPFAEAMATIDVFATNTGDNTITEIVTGGSADLRSTTFRVDSPGEFEFSVRVNLRDGRTLEVAQAGLIRLVQFYPGTWSSTRTFSDFYESPTLYQLGVDGSLVEAVVDPDLLAIGGSLFAEAILGDPNVSVGVDTQTWTVDFFGLGQLHGSLLIEEMTLAISEASATLTFRYTDTEDTFDSTGIVITREFVGQAMGTVAADGTSINFATYIGTMEQCENNVCLTPVDLNTHPSFGSNDVWTIQP
jgi:hypothetical protein